MMIRRLLAVLPVLLLSAVPPSAAAQSNFFAATPSLVDFGTVQVGNRASRDVLGTVLSDAFTSLTVNASSDNPAFTVTPLATTIGFGQPQTFIVTFAPTTPGLQEATISFETPVATLTEEGGSPNQGTLLLDTVLVTGIGATPSFTVAPLQLDFPSTPLGMTSAPLDIRVTSGPNLTRALDVTITSPNPVFQPGATTVTVLPGQFVDVPVTFTPDQSLEVISTIIFRGQDQTFQNVVVRGSGIPFSVNPDPLILPTTLTGCSSNAPINVIPNGTLDYLAGTIDRRFLTRPNQGIQSAPFQLDVSIANVPLGDTMTELIINARELRQVAFQGRVPVSVTAVDLDAGSPSIDFGTVPLGSGPMRQTVSVGGATSQMLMLSVSATSDSSDFVVESVQGDQITVRFDPQAAGTFSGTIVALVSPEVDPDCNRQVRIPVQGAAEQTNITLDPTILDYGPTEIGSTATRTVTLTNGTTTPYRGTVTTTPGAFTIEPGGAGTANFSVPAGGTAAFEIGFSPTASGFQNGTAEFALETATGPTVMVTRSLPLRGEGIQTQLSFEIISGGTATPVASGSTFDAPRTPVGSATFFDFRVLNQGTAPVTISELAVSGAGFTATETTTLPTVVNPGGVLPIVVQFSPSSPGAASGLIAVDDSIFNLNGVGALTGAQITGVGGTLAPASQGQVSLSIEQPVDTPVNGSLILSYQPRNGGDDAMAGFALGGRTAGFTVRPGTTDAVFADDSTSIGLQAGTIAADFNIQAVFDVGGADVSPLTAVEANTAVEAAAPTIVSVSIEDRTATSFTVAVVGYSTTRQVDQASFTFRARSGVQIPNATVSPNVAQAFTTWFESSAFGGLFTLRAPFTVSGADNAASSVEVTLRNSVGTSAPVSSGI